MENHIDLRVDGARVKLFTVGGSTTAEKDRAVGYKDTEDREDGKLEARVPVKAGPRVVGVTFQKRNWYVEGVGVTRLPAASDSYASGKKTEQTYGKIEMGVDSIDIVGPFDGKRPDETPSRRQIFVCRPAGRDGEKPCATRILSTLARRAYRRPVTADDAQTLLGFYDEGRKQAGFDAGIQRALERILVSPNFLFRIENDPPNAAPGAVYALSDLELASRLSFFLWSSVPDDQLIELAARGTLKDKAVLDQQVSRMLNDPRSKALLEQFLRSMALRAQHEHAQAGLAGVSRVRRYPAPGLSA